MATSYLIDGYNLIHALGMLPKKPAAGDLAEARKRLLAFLHQALGVETSQVTVVFDAHHAPKNRPDEDVIHGIQVLFARTLRSADDLLAQLIDHHSDPQHLCVVSNDNEVQRSARRRHAQDLKCDAFLDVLDEKNKQRVEEPNGEERPTQISDEERQGWLETFKDIDTDPSLELKWEHLGKKGRKGIPNRRVE